MNFCDSKIFSTGLPSCDIRPGKPVMLIFAPKSVQITAQDEVDLLAFFEQKARSADINQRVHPIGGEFSNESANTDPVMGTLAGSTYSEKLADGVLASNFGFPMTFCKAKAYKNFDGYKGRVFILTDNGLVIGERTTDGALRGLNVENTAVSVDGIFQDGANLKQVKFTVTFGSDTRLIKQLDAVTYSFDIEDLSGLLSVKLKKAGALTYQVVTACGSVNLYDTYADKLNELSLWKVTNVATNAVLTVADAEGNAAQKAFKLTVTPALTAPYKISVSLADVSALVAEGVTGVEQTEPYIDNVPA
jgi:hypothetical protein